MFALIAKTHELQQQSTMLSTASVSERMFSVLCHDHMLPRWMLRCHGKTPALECFRGCRHQRRRLRFVVVEVSVVVLAVFRSTHRTSRSSAAGSVHEHSRSMPAPSVLGEFVGRKGGRALLFHVSDAVAAHTRPTIRSSRDTWDRTRAESLCLTDG